MNKKEIAMPLLESLSEMGSEEFLENIRELFLFLEGLLGPASAADWRLTDIESEIRRRIAEKLTGAAQTDSDSVQTTPAKMSSLDWVMSQPSSPDAAGISLLSFTLSYGCSTIVVRLPCEQRGIIMEFLRTLESIGVPINPLVPKET